MGAGKTVQQWDEWTAAMKAKHRNGNGHGDSLSIEAQRVAVDWGKYEPAIRRHEAAFQRHAPAPTQPSAKGTPQLAPRFSEWLMGLRDGHVTDPAIWEGMTDKNGKPASKAAIRNAQLKACGNGVVPAQAAEALRVMASWEVAA
jgi:DNA (cytosine-5)-methyltransferase 1